MGKRSKPVDSNVVPMYAETLPRDTKAGPSDAQIAKDTQQIDDAYDRGKIWDWAMNGQPKLPRSK